MIHRPGTKSAERIYLLVKIIISFLPHPALTNLWEVRRQVLSLSCGSKPK